MNYKIDLEKKMTVDDTYNLVMKLYIANREEFKKLSQEQKETNRRIDKVENKIDNIESKIDNMEHKMGNMQEDIQIIKKLLLEKK